MNMQKQLLAASKALSRRLTGRGLRLRVAESFTGGLISSSNTMISGASEYLAEGIICYSLQSKTQRLGVSEVSISNYGAASCAVLRQMLLGLLKSGADIAIASTGNAGPTSQGGNAGVCFVGCATSNRMVIIKTYTCGSRKRVIERGALLAMESAIRLLDKVYPQGKN